MCNRQIMKVINEIKTSQSFISNQFKDVLTDYRPMNNRVKALKKDYVAFEKQQQKEIKIPSSQKVLERNIIVIGVSKLGLIRSIVIVVVDYWRFIAHRRKKRLFSRSLKLFSDYIIKCCSIEVVFNQIQRPADQISTSSMVLHPAIKLVHSECLG